LDPREGRLVHSNPPTGKRDVKAREEEIRELKGKISRQEAEWASNFEAMKNDIKNLYVAKFEAMIEQTCIIHLGIDFSDVNPCHVMVDGKLVKDL